MIDTMKCTRCGEDFHSNRVSEKKLTTCDKCWAATCLPSRTLDINSTRQRLDGLITVYHEYAQYRDYAEKALAYADTQIKQVALLGAECDRQHDSNTQAWERIQRLEASLFEKEAMIGVLNSQIKPNRVVVLEAKLADEQAASQTKSHQIADLEQKLAKTTAERDALMPLSSRVAELETELAREQAARNDDGAAYSRATDMLVKQFNIRLNDRQGQFDRMKAERDAALRFARKTKKGGTK